MPRPSRQQALRRPRRNQVPDFTFIYEYEVREGPSLHLIAAELQRRGYSVTKLRYPLPWNFRRRRAEVLVTPFLYGDGEVYDLIYRPFRRVGAVVNLQWEQIRSVGEDARDNSTFTPSGSAVQAQHICWGEYSREKLLRGRVPAAHLHVTGAPQMDVFRPENAQMLISRQRLFSEFGLPVNAPTVLFISSFSYASLTPAELADIARRVGPEVDVDGFHDISVRSQAAVIEWLVRAARANPGTQFIYRPHPSERANPALLTGISGIDNLHALSEHPVQSWIASCDRIYTWLSTALGEAYYGKGQCAVLRPLPVPTGLELSYLAAAPKLESYEAFATDLAGTASFPLTRECMEHYYGVDPGRASHQRIADVLEAALLRRRAGGPRADLSSPDLQRRLRQHRRAVISERFGTPVKRRVKRLLPSSDAARRRAGRPPTRSSGEHNPELSRGNDEE